MNPTKIEFHSLVKQFTLNEKPAFIINLKEGGKITPYISFYNNCIKKHQFLSFDQCCQHLRTFFDDVSENCILEDCSDARFMFCNSPITSFKTKKTLNIENAEYMFYNSHLNNIKAIMPKLKKTKGIFKNINKPLDLQFFEFYID